MEHMGSKNRRDVVAIQAVLQRTYAQYQIRDKLRGRDSNYETLEQALKSAGDIRGLAVFNAEQLKPGLEYEGQVRLRLEAGGLPSALQLEALESDKWEVSSQWYRWIMAK